MVKQHTILSPKIILNKFQGREPVCRKQEGAHGPRLLLPLGLGKVYRGGGAKVCFAHFRGWAGEQSFLLISFVKVVRSPPLLQGNQNAYICVSFKDKEIKISMVIAFKDGFSHPKFESDWFIP